MNTEVIIEQRYGKIKTETYTPIYEYRGYTIYRGDIPQWKADINYVDKDGKSVNDKKPIFSSTIRKNKCVKAGNRQIYVASFGGNDGIADEYTSSDWEYTKNQIDSHIEHQREYKRKRIEVLKNSIFRTYECNNVIIRVFLEQSPYNPYESRANIYVNERLLRDTHLDKDFVFNDVLKQVYYNTISRYNSADFKDSNNRVNYFRVKSTEKIDMDILPVYELIGMLVEYQGHQFVPTDVSKDNYKNRFIFEAYQGDKVKIDVDEIQNIKILGECTNTMASFVSLKNKLKFYE